MNVTEAGLSPEDQELVRTLCDESHRKIRSAAHRYLDGVAPALVDDVEQETILQACLHLETLRDHPKPEGWLVVTATNVARNFRRRELRAVPLDEKIMVATVDRSGNLDDCLPNSMKPGDRDILKRYYENGDDIKEIAEDLNTKEETVKKRLLRARERFKQKLDKKK